MRKGAFCKYKACGAITKHMSGYCHAHNRLWVKGYEQAMNDIKRQGVFNFEDVEDEQQSESKGAQTSCESERATLFPVRCPGAK